MSLQSPSLSLSRSSSFAPGPHRRSHPNLHHLSLAPLTPKYPIDPADYSAYFDPSTSELHTSASISHIASLPSPGGILSRSGSRSTAHSRAHSRANSRTRLGKKAKNASFVTIGPLTEGSGGNIPGPYGASSSGLGHKSISEKRLASIHTSGQALRKSDSSWLIQTGLTLTEGSRESKGQSWLSKRDSSTSLATPIDERPSVAVAALRSGRNTPHNLSRRGSFQDKRRSKRSLAMTAASPTTPMMEIAVPDWADDSTQAEIAAQYPDDFGDGFDSEDEEGDPYGHLDFEGQFDSEDEDELRRSIKGYRLGAWMDGLVDVFLQLEDDFQGSDTGKSGRQDGRDEESEEVGTASSAVKGTNSPAGSTVRFDESVEPPPERPKSIWDDVAWFGRMVARTVRS
ncbi:hypothetical protein H2200_005919 [Cladophialophora chaetospira]|uniref:Uncharacterized protein n=1 Tax=Cladophialophora chaetospira TaxID=386627 RepID=A0AA38X9Z0_9EURO|nr:hypothetical protein H2200_005919 [Cladophialophora chaetospira]